MESLHIVFIIFYVSSFIAFAFCFWTWYMFQSINKYLDYNYSNANVISRLKKVENDIKIVSDYIMTTPSSVSSS